MNQQNIDEKQAILREIKDLSARAQEILALSEIPLKEDRDNIRYKEEIKAIQKKAYALAERYGIVDKRGDLHETD